MPSGKRQPHSVDRWRNASGVFRKASETFLISYLYLVDTEILEVHADIALILLKSIRPPAT